MYQKRICAESSTSASTINFLITRRYWTTSLFIHLSSTSYIINMYLDQSGVLRCFQGRVVNALAGVILLCVIHCVRVMRRWCRRSERRGRHGRRERREWRGGRRERRGGRRHVGVRAQPAARRGGRAPRSLRHAHAARARPRPPAQLRHVRAWSVNALLPYDGIEHFHRYSTLVGCEQELHRDNTSWLIFAVQSCDRGIHQNIHLVSGT